MASYNLETARKAARERNEKPPGGEQPGTPAYDNWVMAWFEAGLDAGDPDLVKRAGGSAAEEAEGGITDFSGAAGPDQWLGKRNPTPRELRKYAKMTGQSEDYQRFDDRQLAAWIGQHWDTNRGGFFSESGQRLDKPTETGGAMDPYKQGAGDGGGFGGGLGASQPGLGGPASPAIDPTTTPEWLRNSPLAQMLANQGGYLSQYDLQRGNDRAALQGGVMQGGSIWYQPMGTGQSPPATGILARPAPAGSRSFGLAPGADGATKTTPGGGFNTPVGGGPPAPPALAPATGVGLAATPGLGGMPKGGPGGGFNMPGSGSPLTNAMAPLQAGTTGAAADPLTGMLGSIAKPRAKRVGGWF